MTTAHDPGPPPSTTREADRRLVALAAVFAPARAAALVSRWTDPARREAPEAASAPRRERLEAFARLLRPWTERETVAIEEALSGERPRTRLAARAALRAGTGGREEGRAHALLRRLLAQRLDGDRLRPPDEPTAAPESAIRAGFTAARSVNRSHDVTLPFEMPTFSAGYALIAPRTIGVGAAAAAAAAQALGALTMGEAAVAGRALPTVPTPLAGAVCLRVDLTGLPGAATLEVEVGLAASLLDRLCGGAGEVGPVSAATELERSALELAVLAVIDGLSALDEIERPLAPRLTRADGQHPTGLAVELTISLGARRGRARLLLPIAAVRALRGHPRPSTAAAGIALELSLRGGSAPLAEAELASLEPGDVVVVDPPPPGRRVVVAPGGLRVAGTESGDALLVEEIQMPPASEYPIALEVELARVPVSLGELAALEPGSLLPLPVDRRGLVTLKLGDRTFARGQLVDVDGAVGVRIDSLAGSPP